MRTRWILLFPSFLVWIGLFSLTCSLVILNTFNHFLGKSNSYEKKLTTVKHLSKCITIRIPFGFGFLPMKKNKKVMKMPNRAPTPRKKGKKKKILWVFFRNCSKPMIWSRIVTLVLSIKVFFYLKETKNYLLVRNIFFSFNRKDWSVKYHSNFGMFDINFIFAYGQKCLIPLWISKITSRLDCLETEIKR